MDVISVNIKSALFILCLVTSVFISVSDCHQLTDHHMTLRLRQRSCTKFRLWNHWQVLHVNLCSSCCVTCLIHVCELQGVVIGVFDSLLSRKECFQSLLTSTGTKKCVEFPLRDFHRRSGAVLRKKMHPILAAGSQAGDMREEVNVLRAVSNSCQFMSLLSVWPVREVRKLKWHMCNALLPFFSQLQASRGAMVTEVWKVWIRQGGRQLWGPVSLEVRQKKEKRKKRRPYESEPDSLECSQTLAWTVPLPLPL